jgi:hypothetical protein
MNPEQIPPTDAPVPPALEGLQFQRAEQAVRQCGNCSAAIAREYYQLNGMDLCPACTQQWESMQGSVSGGRLLRGLAYGLGGAIGGAILMAVISAVTGYTFALAAIAVGWMVGRAFRIGTGGLGGRRCQWLAVGLAYFGITLSFLPALITGAREAAKQETSRKADVAGGSKTGAPQPAEVGQSGEAREPVGAAGFAVAMVVILGLTLASPFLMLFSGIGGLINVAIVFFGLQRAWHMMAGDPRVLTGPYGGPSAA